MMKFRIDYIIFIAISLMIFSSTLLYSQETTVNKENIKQHIHKLGSDQFQGRGTGAIGVSATAKYHMYTSPFLL
jgi:hypothetical protein